MRPEFVPPNQQNPNTIFETILVLDQNGKQHNRQVYNIMDLLGDIAGIYELITLSIAILINKIAKESFVIVALKKFFFVKSKYRQIFDVKAKNEGQTHEDKLNERNQNGLQRYLSK